jgi:thioredoxin 1
MLLQCNYVTLYYLLIIKRRIYSMAIVNASDQSFKTEVESGTVLVDFWAPWCGPCKMIAPVLEEIDQEIGDKLKIVKVNVDENPETASQFGIMSIPTLMVMKGSEVVDKFVGFQPKEALVEKLNTHL